jgi:immune inhibitor A
MRISFCIVIIILIAAAGYGAPPNPKLFYKDGDPLKPMMSIAKIAQMQTFDPDVPRAKYAQQPDGIEYILVIRIDFSDQPGKKPASVFDDAIFGKIGTSMYLYYDEVSYGQMQILPGYLDGVMPKGDSWYRASKKMSYYGTGNIAVDKYRELVQEACVAADAEVDFSKYDRDNDGFVDHLMIIHSGDDEASTGVTNDIWSAEIDAVPGVYDGKRIMSAMIVAEDPGENRVNVGIYCHEFFHEFGAPDLYTSWDYPAGFWCLMGNFGPYLDNGQHPAHICSYLKWDFDADRTNGIRGWLEPVTLKSDGAYSVDALELPSKNHTYKVDIPGKDGKEYFLIENRSNKAGTIYDTYLPESGIMIWHIDENQSKSFGYPHRVWLEDPDDPARESRKPTSGAAYSAEDKQTEFTPSTNPNSNANDSTYSGIIITDIGKTGTTMTFSLFVGDTYEPNNSIAQAYGPLEFGKRYVSFLWDQKDLDFFMFHAEANTMNIIYLEDIPYGLDYELQVFNIQGKLLFATNEPEQSTKKLSFKTNKSETYYVEVVSNFGYSSKQHYSLTVDSILFELAPGTLSISRIYPNPGPDKNGQITFEYVLLEPVDRLTLDIYTLKGTLIHTQNGDNINPKDKLYWDTNGLKLASGVYIYVLKTELKGKTEVKTGKIAILK